LEEIEVGGRIILKRIFKFEWEEVKSIGLYHDGDNLCAFEPCNEHFISTKGGEAGIFDNM
jgi:hypothetical protein